MFALWSERKLNSKERGNVGGENKHCIGKEKQSIDTVKNIKNYLIELLMRYLKMAALDERCSQLITLHCSIALERKIHQKRF